MPLNNAQLAALKADIALDGALSALPNNSDSHATIAAAYNAVASPDFMVWATNAPVAAILDSITWDNYTPNDAADNTATYSNRLLLIQTKQMNLQNLLIGRDKIDASKANIRGGLRDAVINLPSGPAGANRSAGGANGVTVMNTLLRKATRAEKLYSTANAQTGGVTGNLLVFEGTITGGDVSAALNLP